MYRVGRGGGRRAALLTTAALACCLGAASLGDHPAAAQTQTGSKTQTGTKTQTTSMKSRSGVSFERIAFSALPGWSEDDHLAALKTFLRSCERLEAAARAAARPRKTRSRASATPPPEMIRVCQEARRLPARLTRTLARSFFERHFAPHRVRHAKPAGLLTGYYEPVIEGSRVPTARFRTPVLRRPADLVNLVPESGRAGVGQGLTHARKVGTRHEPFPTRAEIEQGSLSGQGLELLYLAHPVDLFFMQIQGSGRIKLQDGSSVRLGYDGKNGHPYTSIGRYLIERGEIDANRMSLAALARWLKADPKRAQRVMWQNASYVFFRELDGEQARAPLGAMGIPLTTGRSLAVDTRYHALGTPIFVSAPTLLHAHPTKTRPFQRLMIAQDVGSAIKGPERGDIYFGSGRKAGRIAGVTKHGGAFYTLLPVAGAPSQHQVSAAR